MAARTPAEIDTALAKLDEQVARRQQSLAWMLQDSERDPANRVAHYFQNAERVANLRAEIAALIEQIRPLDAEYARRRWSRFFLVLNGNGHVHRDRACSTCFPTTLYGWLPQLSGATEQEAVAEYGERMCTVCFPSAPSMYQMLGRPSRAAAERQAAKDARQAKRDAIAAKKAAAAITNPDGTVLKGTNWRVETVTAAWRDMVDAYDYLPILETRNPERHGEYLAAIERVSTALAAKLGRTVDDIKAEAQRRLKRRPR